MDGLIRAILSFTGLSNLARKVYSATDSLWLTLVALFTGTVKAALFLATAGATLAANAGFFGAVLVRYLFWLGKTRVPALISVAIGKLTSLTLRLIRDVTTLIHVTAQGIVSWATKELGKLDGLLNSFKSWATGQVRSIITLLNWVRDRVVALLTDPSALAAWVFIPLWHYLTRYVNDHAEMLGRWILANAIRAAMSTASVIEDVIVSIF